MNFIWLLIKSNPLKALGAFAVLFSVVFGYGYYKGYNHAEDTIKSKTITKVVTIQERKNEIRNNRPDTAVLTDILRNGKF